ncbi:QOR1_2 [Sanghuangporus sanghuang]
MRVMLSKKVRHEREDLVTLPVGTPFPTYAVVGRIIQAEGKDDQFKVGDIVKVSPIPGASISAYLGALGETVYWALKGVLKPKETDTLIVSGAAGALGCVAVQYAKKVLNVKRVVAIAGTDEKCEWVKSIGADEAANYKSLTFVKDIETATLDKADLFLDIVGGSILDEVLMRMKTHGIICEAGAMAKTVIDIDGQMEKVPIVWNGLFTGANKGKLITKVAN